MPQRSSSQDQDTVNQGERRATGLKMSPSQRQTAKRGFWRKEAKQLATFQWWAQKLIMQCGERCAMVALNARQESITCPSLNSRCPPFVVLQQSPQRFMADDVFQAELMDGSNAGERSLRHAVIWRKPSFGRQSAAGSRFIETMLTVIETCRQQRRNVFSFVRNAVESHLAHQPAPSLLPGACMVTWFPQNDEVAVS